MKAKDGKGLGATGKGLMPPFRTAQEEASSPCVNNFVVLDSEIDNGNVGRGVVAPQEVSGVLKKVHIPLEGTHEVPGDNGAIASSDAYSGSLGLGDDELVVVPAVTLVILTWLGMVQILF